MPAQILTLKLDGITAGDRLTWCRDPDPPAITAATQRDRDHGFAAQLERRDRNLIALAMA